MDHADQGMRCLEMGHFAEAEKHLTFALAKDKNSPVWLYLRAKARSANVNPNTEKSQFEKALQDLNKCLEADDPIGDAYYLKARILESMGLFADAPKLIERALQSNSLSSTCYKEIMKRKELEIARLKSKDDEERLHEQGEESIRNRSTMHQDWFAGREREAILGAQKVIEKDPSNLDACEILCWIFSNKNQAHVVAPIVIKCVVLNSESQGPVRRRLASILGHMLEKDENIVLNLLPPEQGLAECVGFIAILLKEQGMLDVATKHYYRACTMDKTHGLLCLNLMHTYTYLGDIEGAINFGMNFLENLGRRRNGYYKFQPKHKQYIDALAIVFTLVKCIYVCYPPEAFLPFLPSIQQGDYKNGITLSSEMNHSKKEIDMCEQENCALSNESTSEVSDASGKREDPWRMSFPLSEPSIGWPLPEDQKPRAGALKQIEFLIHNVSSHLSEEVILGLHRTNIRNEWAFYQCIMYIVGRKWETVPRLPQEIRRPIYVIGDSHVLSSAWQQYKDFFFIPHLVTGLKIWHLRDRSIAYKSASSDPMYTATSFWSILDRINQANKRAPIVFSLGEIDIREGVVSALCKKRYSDESDALSTLVTVLVDVLQRVRQLLDPNLQIFLHPIPNVLQESRLLTARFHTLLLANQEKFDNLKVTILSFPPTVVDDQLSKSLELDGTHYSPNYVHSHLGPALERAIK